MSSFSIGFYALLILSAAVANYYKKQTMFKLLVLLIVISAVSSFAIGEGLLKAIAILMAIISVSAVVSYSFRALVVMITPKGWSKVFRTAPLTAGFGMFVIFAFAIICIFTPFIAPYTEAEIISSAYAPADGNMLLGADQLGRDMLSRILYGARNTIGLALLATLLAFLMGATTGLYAATKGGVLDQLLGRMVDVVMSIPSLIFALLLLSIYGTSTITLTLVLAFIYAPRVFRVARSVGGNVVVMDYIEAAKLRGESTWYLIRKEILPNSMAPLIADFGLEFCFVFLLVAGLSFLGLGIQPPTADWGSMVRENAILISFGEITPLIPAGAIALLTVSVNFVVDWVLHLSSGLKE